MSYWLRPEPIRPAPDLPEYEDAEERAARRTVWLLGAGIAALAIGAVVFFTVRTLREAGSESPVVTTPEDAARAVGGIGPPSGTDVAAYIDARNAALATATGDRIAIVSFTSYTTEAKAKALVAPVEVIGVMAAAPGGQPAAVQGDLAGWVQSQTAEARAERDEIQRLIPTVDEGNFKRFYQSEVDRLNQLIAAVRPNGDLAFGVVVRADATALQQLAARGEVRLVDVGPNAEPQAPTEYRGLRPEETGKANDPNTRPV